MLAEDGDLRVIQVVPGFHFFKLGDEFLGAGMFHRCLALRAISSLESAHSIARMQRLFSMFPTGWPGIALLLLRVALSANLVRGFLEAHANLDTAWVLALLSTVGIALCVGLFTPATAALCALIEIAVWDISSGTIAALHVCAILVAVALAMLGPSAYSLDAKLFGRRKVIFPPSDGSEDK